MQSFDSKLSGVERCPHCSVARPLLSKVWGGALWDRDLDTVRQYGVYECSACHRAVLAEGALCQTYNDGSPKVPQVADSVAELFPKPPTVDEALPKDAQRYLKQALETLHAPDASAVMSASAVDSLLKEKGYREGSLYTRIGKAVSDHLLTEAMGDWAHAVRLEANAVRHADAGDRPLTADDSRQILDFAKALGDFLFVFSARVDAGLKKASQDDAQ